MPNFRDITGLTHNQANDGFPIAQIPGDAAILGPSIIVLFAIGVGLPPSDPTISIQLFPTGASAVGTDSLGQISIVKTIVNTGDDKTFDITGGGQVIYPDGSGNFFWTSKIRGVVNSLLGTREFHLQYIGLDPDTDFPDTLTDTPDNVNHQNEIFDPDTDEGDVEITFSYDNSSAENPTGLVIRRSKDAGPFDVVGSLPWVNGQTDYLFKDYVHAVGEYCYEIQAYKYDVPNAISLVSNIDCVTFSVLVCNIDIFPTSNHFPKDGGSGIITVTVEAGCVWSAISSEPWLVIISGSFGIGNGEISYIVEENTEGFRSGTITVVVV